jgi:acetyl esterase/lipase
MDAHMLEDCGPFNRMVGLTDCHADARSPESLLLGYPIQSRPDLVRQANPIAYVRPDVAPFLILHGQRDLLVPHNQSELLYEALSAGGADVTFVTLPRGEHGQWNEYLSDPAISADALARSPRDGHGGVAQDVPLSWDTIASFFAQHLVDR